MEQESDLVKIGKIYHDDLPGIEIDNMRIDKLRNGKVFELKKKRTAPEAARFQVLYYLYRLRQKGINTTGIIKYQENNQIENVELTDENEKQKQNTAAITSCALPKMLRNNFYITQSGSIVREDNTMWFMNNAVKKAIPVNSIDTIYCLGEVTAKSRLIPSFSCFLLSMA